ADPGDLLADSPGSGVRGGGTRHRALGPGARHASPNAPAARPRGRSLTLGLAGPSASAHLPPGGRSMAVDVKKVRSIRSAGPLAVRLPADVEERLRRRIEETGLPRAKAVTFLVTFALELDAELQDIEPELGWYAMNRRIPVSRAIAQL